MSDKNPGTITWDQRPKLKEFFCIVDGAKLELSAEAWTRINDARKVVEDLLASGRPIYGLNRGLGSLKNHALSFEELSSFNQAVWQAHAIVVDNVPLVDIEVRALIAARIVGLIRGVSGARSQLVQCLIECLNKGLYPIVRARYLSVGEAGSRSYGASGMCVNGRRGKSDNVGM